MGQKANGDSALIVQSSALSGNPRTGPDYAGWHARASPSAIGNWRSLGPNAVHVRSLGGALAQ